MPRRFFKHVSLRYREKKEHPWYLKPFEYILAHPQQSIDHFVRGVQKIVRQTPQRMGGFQAMQIMLTGRQLRAGQARALGLVDQLVGPHGGPRWAARKAVLKGKKSRKPSWTARMTNSGPMRKFLAGQMRKKSMARAKWTPR